MDRNEYKPSLLIVDDEPHFSESLQIALEDSYTVSKTHSLSDAKEAVREEVPDAILLDIRLPDGNGIKLLGELREGGRMPVVIIMTAYATIDDAVTALKEGAVDYFTKPLDIEKLKRELNVYLENKSLQKKVITLDREIKKIIPPFVTSGTGKMKEIVEKVPMIAPLTIPVLLKGETGTGKERLANWIHELSGMTGELVAINCSSLPKELFESELFGHTRGAFSGAVSHKEGLIERAEGGTLFLDEIGELPGGVQAKLLRVLEDGVYYKVGDSKEHRAKFRLISATGKDLSDPAGNFRSDLYYRINGITFALPPLRERKEDIPLLVSTFIREANGSCNKNVTGVSAGVMESFMARRWPGNIRELKWLIHRAVAITAKGVLDTNEISVSPGAFGNAPAGGGIDYSVPFQDALDTLEKNYLERALAAARRNKTEAAKMLGISVRALHYKIKKYDL